MKAIQKARCVHETREKAVWPCQKLGNFKEEKRMALLTFLTNLYHIYDNCSVCVDEAV